MRCRRCVKDEFERYNVVWFGSYGTEYRESEVPLTVLENGLFADDELFAGDTYITPVKYAKFYDPNDKHANYASKQEGVMHSLEQRLAIIQGELWYNPRYGIPLLEKVNNKGLIDAVIIEEIYNHPDVDNIQTFTSRLVNHTYSCSFSCTTRFTTEAMKIAFDLK